MEIDSRESQLVLLQESKINRRDVWFYAINTPIGTFHVVQYERTDWTIKRFVWDEGFDKAAAKYEAVCRGILSGRI